jgi:small subunit ribosomal protein S9
MVKVVLATGKRKSAKARALIRAGTGKIRLNSFLLEAYPNEFLRMKIMEPLLILGAKAKKIDISIRMRGGGISSQIDAARLAIGRGLVKWTGSDALKEKFLEYDRHLLIADPRRTEPCKPNRSKPRSKRQKSYR